MIRRQENSLKACLYDISEGLYVGCAALAFHPCQFKKNGGGGYFKMHGLRILVLTK